MKNKISILFLTTVIISLFSCTKDNDIEQPSFEDVLTSQLWVKSIWGNKPGTDPDATNVPYENYMMYCDSNLLLSFRKDGVFEQFLSSECKDYNRIGPQDSWEYIQDEHYIRIYTSAYVNSYVYNVKHYSKEEIYFYIGGIGIHTGDEFVTIVKLVPYK